MPIERLLQIKYPDAVVKIRDLSKDKISTLDTEKLYSLSNHESPASIEEALLIEELKNADKIIIGAPMYNFNVPAVLHNYFDVITKAGKTFKYTESGPVGLLDDREVTVVITRGGMYKNRGIWFQEDYIKMQLGLIGFKSVNFVFIEGLNMGLDQSNYEKQFDSQVK